MLESLDVFSRNEYKDIVVVNSLKSCRKEKGLKVFAWWIKANHVHLIFRSTKGQETKLLLGDFKRFTSKGVVKKPRESRKDWRGSGKAEARHRSIGCE